MPAGQACGRGDIGGTDTLEFIEDGSCALRRAAIECVTAAESPTDVGQPDQLGAATSTTKLARVPQGGCSSRCTDDSRGRNR